MGVLGVSEIINDEMNRSIINRVVSLANAAKKLKEMPVAEFVERLDSVETPNSESYAGIERFIKEGM